VRLGRSEQARTLLEALVRDGPVLSASWSLLAQVQLQLGDSDAEGRALEVLRDLMSPDDPARTAVERRLRHFGR